MSKSPKSLPERSTLVSYVVGYILSIYLTVMAYLLVANHMNSKVVLIGLVVGLALLQFAVQLLFFLHLGREMRPRLKLLAFLAMIMIVSILVFGSLWIMYNLNYHKTPQQIYKYLNNQGDGI